MGTRSTASAAAATAAPLDATRVEALVDEAYRAQLRREPDDAGRAHWVEGAGAVAALGSSEAEVAAWLTSKLHESPEYQALQLVDRTFEQELGRSIAGTRDYWHEEAVAMARDGSVPLADVEAHLVASLKGSEEYQLGHLGEVVEQLYPRLLGRPADAEGHAGWTRYAEALKGEGKGLAEIRAALEQGFMDSDEWRRLHAPPPADPRRWDREGYYLQQPNGWTCAPTSLTIALAHHGLRANDLSTMWELAAQTGTRAGVGLPGDASLVAAAARQNGLQAEFSASRGVADVRAELEAGRGVIVNGDINGGGHFLYLAGLDEQGRFIVADPFRPGITRWSDADLHHFTHSGNNPPGYAAVWR